MPETAAFWRALMARLPDGVALGHEPIGGDDGLLPGEVLAGAVPARLAEFAAGRRAVRRAMASLGAAPLAVPHGSDRAPVWPPGLTGSISHCAGVAGAVAGRSALWLGLGLDLEPDKGLPADLWDEILRGEESAQVQTLPEAQHATHVLQIFQAKEAVYKALFPVARSLFGFDALRVEPTAAGFTAQLMQPVRGFSDGFRVEGIWLQDGGLSAAFCAVPAPRN